MTEQSLSTHLDWWDASLEDKMLAQHLVSCIEKGEDHISITLTGKGLSYILNALSEREGKLSEQQKEADGDTLVSKRDTMQLLGVSDTTLWLWAQKHYLNPVKIGRRVLYRKADINVILKGGDNGEADY